MSRKICTKCNVEKPYEDFSKQKTNNDGYRNICKLCMCEYSKIRRLENLGHERNRAKAYYVNNKTHKQQYAINNADTISQVKKIYRENNKDYFIEYQKSYRKENKEKINKRENNYYRQRCQSNPVFKLKKNIQRAILRALQSSGYTKKSRTYQILGCTFEEFKQHIEAQWQDWMSWDNYGLYNGELNYGWDIDHIIPLASDKTENGITELNHYTNLQPLCSKVNRDIKRDL